MIFASLVKKYYDVVASKKKAKAIVRITQVVDELSDVDDQDELPAGEDRKGSYIDYHIETSFTPTRGLDKKDPNTHETEAETAVLDELHETVPIGCLDDFDIKIKSLKIMD